MISISTHLGNISISTYLVVFIAGVATSFTPCAYPLVPIIAGVIGSSKQKSLLRNFLLSLNYVLGMALTFSLLGLAAALTGVFFGQIQSSPLTYLIVGSIIILFALALLDFISLPTFFLNRAGAGRIIKGSSGITVFIMGVVSGFVAAPCAVAVLGALLAYVASTQNLVLGFTLLFTFATGLGTLLIIVGTFTGILSGLTKLAKWMPLIQKMLALAMILLGAYFIFRGISL